MGDTLPSPTEWRVIASRRSVRVGGALVTAWALLLSTACGGDDENVTDPDASKAGSNAAWWLAPGQQIAGSTTEFDVDFTGTECNNGEKQTALEPRMVLTKKTVTITFRATPPAPESALCPGTAPVRYHLQLPEQIGDRKLIDGTCALDDAPKESIWCDPTGLRWSAASGTDRN